jgi:hypothetical protein
VVRDGIRGGRGLVGIDGGRLTSHRNVIGGILSGIGGIMYTEVMHVTGILTKRGWKCVRSSSQSTTTPRGVGTVTVSGGHDWCRRMRIWVIRSYFVYAFEVDARAATFREYFTT